MSEYVTSLYKILSKAFYPNQSKSHSLLMACDILYSLPLLSLFIVLLAHRPVYWSADLPREVSSYIRILNVLFPRFCKIHFCTSLSFLLKSHFIVELCRPPYIEGKILYLWSSHSFNPFLLAYLRINPWEQGILFCLPPSTVPGTE